MYMVVVMFQVHFWTKFTGEFGRLPVMHTLSMSKPLPQMHSVFSLFHHVISLYRSLFFFHSTLHFSFRYFHLLVRELTPHMKWNVFSLLTKAVYHHLQTLTTLDLNQLVSIHKFHKTPHVRIGVFKGISILQNEQYEYKAEEGLERSHSIEESNYWHASHTFVTNSRDKPFYSNEMVVM